MKSRTIFTVVTTSLIALTSVSLAVLMWRSIYKHYDVNSDPIGYELIPKRYSQGYHIKKNSIVYQDGKRIGKIRYPTYIDYPGNLDQENMIVYAWIWSESVKVNNDSIATLINSENLRIASNRCIFARFVEGSRGKFIYENPRKSWMLIQFNVSSDAMNISSKKVSFFSTRPQMTITHSGGGDFPDERGMSPLSFLAMGSVGLFYLFMKSIMMLIRRRKKSSS